MRKKIFLALLLASLSTFLMAAPVFAANCNGVDTTLIECNDGDGANGVWILIGNVVNILSIGVLLVATIATIVAGIQYMSARDNPAQTGAAKKRLINMGIGLAAFAFLYVLFGFIIPGGISGVNQEWEDASKKRQETAQQATQQEQSEQSQPQQPTQPEESQPEQTEQPQQEQPQSSGSVTATVKEFKPAGYKNAYQITELSAGATPYVYTPNNGKGVSASTAINKLKNTNALVVANAGTFEKDTTASGTVIANGSVIKSGNTCTALVIGQNGTNPGWAERGVSASGLVGGTTQYHDMNGSLTTSKVYSAVSCFSPIIVGGKVADGSSSSFNFQKYSSHYRNTRARQILCVKGSPSSPLYSIISNKNEGTTGGWNWNHMTKVARDYGCVFAYNLDGGGSTATWTRSSTSADFKHYGGSRSVPTYIVFTANNQPVK